MGKGNRPTNRAAGICLFRWTVYFERHSWELTVVSVFFFSHLHVYSF